MKLSYVAAYEVNAQRDWYFALLNCQAISQERRLFVTLLTFLDDVSMVSPATPEKKRSKIVCMSISRSYA